MALLDGFKVIPLKEKIIDFHGQKRYGVYADFSSWLAHGENKILENRGEDR